MKATVGARQNDRTMAIFRMILRYRLFTVLAFTRVRLLFMRKSERAGWGILPQTHLITTLRTRGRGTSTRARACSWRLGTSNELVFADLARTVLDTRCGRLKRVWRRNFGEFLR
jgi:hypothetical protein